MRKLKTADLFSLTRIIKKMNIKNEIKALAKDVTGLSDEDKLKAKDSINIDLILLFVENIGNAEKEIYKLLSDMSDKTVKEIENQSPIKTVEMIQSIFEDEEIESFLKLALK
ncbi:MAG: hypothetical protein ABF633_01755 [Clostridium sp.]|uniref:hypothetical protein n=1 Tax=Clostridium sp. TaxID=1506 RepID=UPI0039E8D804